MAKKPAGPPDDDTPHPPERILTNPTFSQPQPTPDPDVFKINHPSDGAAYKVIDKLNAEHKLHAMPFSAPRGGIEPAITLTDVFGGNQAAIDRIEKEFQQIVFHATGDCGSTRGPKTQNEVVDKMSADFTENDAAEVPQFALLLGDIVYNFGEIEYYYDQFYEPYRNYHAPVLACAGNHDGMISPLQHQKSLEAFQRNFCQDPKNGYVVQHEAGGLTRTAQIQPGVFFTLDAPFVRILVFYSNTLEDPGVIADDTIGDSQLKFLDAVLLRVKQEDYQGALLFAHHHPPYAMGGQHSSSTVMLAQMDEICAKHGVWPHAVLAGHAHSYQRFTRHRADGTEIPYIICGNGGHNVQKLKNPRGSGPLRTPQIKQKKADKRAEVTFENYDDLNYGYLRLVVDAVHLRIEYHPASDGANAKTPDDNVTIDLKAHKRGNFKPNDMGLPEDAEEIRKLLDAEQKNPYPKVTTHRSHTKAAHSTRKQ